MILIDCFEIDLIYPDLSRAYEYAQEKAEDMLAERNISYISYKVECVEHYYERYYFKPEGIYLFKFRLSVEDA